jgi:lipid-A-disaccharide synthase
LEGFKKAREQYPALRAQVIYPSSKILQLLETQLSDHSELVEAIEFVPNTSECLPASAVLMSSGTMSLACALSGIPGAIAYRLNPMSYWLGRLLVNIKFIGIANLLLDRALHPEYIQGAATGDKLGSELKRALGDAEAAEVAASSSVALRGLLGSGCDRSAAHWLAAGLDI